MPYRHNFILLFATVTLSCFGFANMAAAELRGHKAQYEVFLVSAEPSAGIVSVKGHMDYDVSKDCQGWTSAYGFDLRHDYMNMSPVLLKTQIETFETDSHDFYAYNLTRKMQDQLMEERVGKAEKHGSSIKVSLEKPESLNVEYTDTLFPIEHAQILVEKAKSGQKFFSASIFEGLDPDGRLMVNAVILPITDQGDDHTHNDIATLDKAGKAWRVHMGYFKENKEQDVSAYELKATLYETGVMDDIEIDYHGYVIGQELSALDFKAQPDCD